MNTNNILDNLSLTNNVLTIFQKAIKLDPKNIELQHDISLLYAQQKKFQDAIKLLNNVLKVNPRYSKAAISLGRIYIESNDLLNAQKIINMLFMVNPDDPEVIELSKQLDFLIKNNKKKFINSRTQLSNENKIYNIDPIKILTEFSERDNIEKITLSIVIPINNEEENIPVLYDELINVLKQFKEKYEIIFIDDGSNDNSFNILNNLANDNPDIKVIQFRRRYGQTAAMSAGFQYCSGNIIVTMDGDLQNDPADIPRLLEKMEQGFDLVSGWRKNRKDRFLSRKIPSLIANKIINWLISGTGVKLNDYGCTLKAYKRGIVKNIHLYGEMHRFIPVFAAWLGVNITEIPVNHRERIKGETKYNLSRVSRVIFDLVLVRFYSDYLTRPIQFFGKIAKLLMTMGLSFIFILALLTLFVEIQLSFNTLLILFAILLLACLQIFFVGLLGEIMIRSYFEGQNKNYFTIKTILNDYI